jgi:hypothetical protein
MWMGRHIEHKKAQSIRTASSLVRHEAQNKNLAVIYASYFT